MATGAANLIAFETALDQQGIKYTELEKASHPAVRIGYNMENIEHLDIIFFFDQDGQTVHYMSGPIAHVPEAKTEVALGALNDANLSYRWLKFFLDNDNDIIASGDQILKPDTVGDTCDELLKRSLQICDTVYTKFMKAIWAED